MPNDDRPEGLSVKSIKLIDIGVTKCIGDDFDSDFSSFRRINPDFFNAQGFFGFISNCSFA